MQLITEKFHLLGARFSTRKTPYRPPWAIAELPFIRNCDNCGKCIEACPEHILVYGRGDYPEVDFSSGGCTFCGKCSQACEPGGLRPPENHPWNQQAFIDKTCLANNGTECEECGDACPKLAIIFRPQVGSTPVPILEEMICDGCGTCVSACPASAVHVYRLI